MLRKLRIGIAIFFGIFITLLFLDFTGTLHAWFGWMAKIQFLPAILALNVGVVIFLLLLTLLFGRLYCSIICPMGVFQDVISRISGYNKKRRNRFGYTKEKKILRISVLAIFIALLVFGINSIALFLAPYSAYGRIAANMFAPIYMEINNLLAYIAERIDSYTFYNVDVWIKSSIALIVSVITFAVVAVLSWRYGRSYCNTICPVGTFLGYIAKYSLFRPTINTEKCNSCGLCARGCKASCIDGKEHKIDYSRCVMCFDCIQNCRQHAISYTLRRKSILEKESIDTSRRKFLTVSAAVISTAVVKAQEKKVDGGIAAIEDKQIPNRATKIVPPGALSANNFTRHCTACQLCIAECPNGVLRPSNDLATLMQPEVSYERGYCRPECTRCSDVCPTGAIIHIDKADKSSVQIGHAVWIKKNCVVITDDVSCGNCARHCPVGAIRMVSVDGISHRIPVVEEERCIGCGACENLCPSRPFSAIYVEGHEVHRTV